MKSDYGMNGNIEKRLQSTIIFTHVKTYAYMKWFNVITEIY
jgi:hypothetical protein